MTLFHSISSAQTYITNSYTNTFPTGGNTTFFTGGSVASYIEWYGLSFNNTAMTNDPTMDAAGDTNESGSLYCSYAFTNSGNQVQVMGTFDNAYSYDNSVQMPLNLITNLACDIHVMAGTVPDSSGDFGQLTLSMVAPGWEGGGRDGTWTSITIPGAASNGWVHLQDTNVVADIQTLINSSTSADPTTNAAGIGIYYNSYGGFPTNPITFWIDNLAVTTSSAPPPPPPPPTVSMLTAAAGLNLFTGSGTGLYQRESLEADQVEYTWVGATNPVTYSFTIASYPVNPGDQVQNHIFLIPSPGTETAPDYTEPNLIFFDMESTGTKATQWMFRYKTNQPNGNAMVYGSGTLAVITNIEGAIGTWTATFNSDTNITMTSPDGTSTNFNIPDTTGATTALFASGVVLYYGAQAGNSGGANDHLVASEFKVTGLGASDFDDNFVTDDGSLNSGIWVVNANAPACVDLVPTGSPFWVQWTQPSLNFTLESTPSLNPPITWSPTTSNPSFLAGTNNTQLIGPGDLPSTTNGFFNLANP